MQLSRSRRWAALSIAMGLLLRLIFQSDFLEMLFKHNCIRTQKKQKVFYWFSVPHDRLFLDALDRDLKREKLGLDTTTQAVAEPALSFSYNPSKSLYEQFAKATADTKNSEAPSISAPRLTSTSQAKLTLDDAGTSSKRYRPAESKRPAVSDSLLGAFSLFEGSPTYKQRRKTSSTGPSRHSSSGVTRRHPYPPRSSPHFDTGASRPMSYSHSPAPEMPVLQGVDNTFFPSPAPESVQQSYRPLAASQSPYLVPHGVDPTAANPASYNIVGDTSQGLSPALASTPDAAHVRYPSR